MSVTPSSSLPKIATGIPSLKLITNSSGFAGASSGSTVHWKTSRGGAPQGSSRTPASMDRPQRFSSTLYGLFFVTGTGIPRAFA